MTTEEKIKEIDRLISEIRAEQDVIDYQKIAEEVVNGKRRVFIIK